MAKPKILSEGHTITLRGPISIRKRGGRKVVLAPDGFRGDPRKLFCQQVDNKADILFRHDSGAIALWTMDGATKVPTRSSRRWGTTGYSREIVCENGSFWRVGEAF